MNAGSLRFPSCCGVGFSPSFNGILVYFYTREVTRKPRTISSYVHHIHISIYSERSPFQKNLDIPNFLLLKQVLISPRWLEHLCKQLFTYFKYVLFQKWNIHYAEYTHKFKLRETRLLKLLRFSECFCQRLMFWRVMCLMKIDRWIVKF